jgi:GNAT superfamily N-acetyltransferase
MIEKLTIRRAGQGDAAAIAEVHVSSWRGAYEGLLPQEMLDTLSVERRAEVWRDLLRRPEQSTFVADDDGKVIGFSSTGPGRDEDTKSDGELYAIYVAPAAWSTGAGHALHEVSVETLGARFDQAVLWVLAANRRARTFYERHGWAADGSTKQDRRGDVLLDEVRYRRRLGREG